MPLIKVRYNPGMSGTHMTTSRLLTLSVLLVIVLLSIAIPMNGIAGRETLSNQVQATSTPTQTRISYFQVPTATSSPVIEMDVYLPLILHHQIALTLEILDTTDGDGTSTSAFLAGDGLEYFAAGVNESGGSMTVEVFWVLDGPCDSGVLYSGEFLATAPVWSIVRQRSAPQCSGIYTHSLTITTPNGVVQSQKSFVVNHPSAVVLTEKAAFDRCAFPTLEQMQTWWDQSPYWVFNLYVGGVSFYCDEPPLDPFWVKQASQQGWQFITTWVGPQASCSRYIHKMSSDPAIAYLQGKDEADQAAQAVRNLGLLGENLIYYDLEGYLGGAAPLSCRAATASFMLGWTERLHQLGYKSGLYGSPCTSYMEDFAPLAYPPDDVWLAYWKYTYYTPSASVWDLPCIDNAYWPDHQRLRQYTGGHVETWGGVSLTIDSNVTDGEITWLPDQPTVMSASASTPRTTLTRTNIIKDAKLTHAGAGWLVMENHLLWTDSNGRNWLDITPPLGRAEMVLSASFLDEHNGWVLAMTEPGRELRLWSTQSRGANWRSLVVDLPPDAVLSVASAELRFDNKEEGSIDLQLVSSSNFSLTKKMLTVDGGRSWQTQPVQVGSPTLDIHLFRHRGFLSKAIDPRILPDAAVRADFLNPLSGWVITQEGECTGDKDSIRRDGSGELHCSTVFHLLSTRDGGNSWSDITPR